jgi:flagellar basal body-associated protein FliL
MSAETLLVPLVIVVIFAALALFAVVFQSKSSPEDPAAESPADASPAEESETWYFLRFEPGEASSDLSRP